MENLVAMQCVFEGVILRCQELIESIFDEAELWQVAGAKGTSTVAILGFLAISSFDIAAFWFACF